MKRAPFLCRKLYAFPLYFLNWMHLSQFKPPWQRGLIEKRSPGWVKAAAHVEAGSGVQSGLT